MPKYRKLYTKSTESFDIADMPDWFTRYMWVTLMLILDRDGKGVDNIGWIKGKLFPIMQEDISDEMVTAAMDCFERIGLIVRYQVDGRPYFMQVNFKKLQGSTEKEAESQYPFPPDQVESKSGVSQELVKSKSSTDADADSNADADADARADARKGARAAEPEDKFDILQDAIEQVIGMPQGLDAIKTINELIAVGAEVKDIQDAAAWYRSQNKTIRSAGQLLGPAKESIRRRKQAANAPTRAPDGRGIKGGLSAAELMLQEVMNGG